MIGPEWRKPNACSIGDCVEVRFFLGMVEVRDKAGILAYTPAEWHTFTEAVKGGEYDLPAEGVAA